MKRSGPPQRKTPLAKSASPLKRTRINPVSKKRQDEKPERDKVREAVLKRDDFTCQARGITDGPDCWGPLDIDEIISRARMPGGHLNIDNCQVLCRGHNLYKEDDPLWALRHGLAKNSWEAS